jgi:hypothetical protein
MSNDTVKDAIEGTIEAAYKPVEKVFKTLLGPAAEEFGLILRDKIRQFRFKGQVKFLQRFQDICIEARINPQSVRLPLLLDIIERASIEPDAELQTLWANLLANAADTKYNGLITNAYPDILRQLSKEEAVFLEELHERMRIPSREEFRDTMRKRLNSPEPSVDPVYEENLRRLGLTVGNSKEENINVAAYAVMQSRGQPTPPRHWTLTALGTAFIKACRTPETRL